MEEKISPTRAWISAIRPKTLTVALVSVMVGTSLAYVFSEQMDWFIAFMALIASFSVQIGTNLINDAKDFDRGADTAGRIGFPRAVQKGWLSRDEVYWVGISFFVAAAIFSIPLIFVGGFIIFILLILSIAAGYCYSGGPYPLAYLGLGEVFVLLFFGYVCTGIPYLVQTGTIDGKLILAGTQTGLLAAVLIAINNVRDIEGDKKADKNTLPVRFGLVFGKLEIVFCILVPLLICPIWFTYGLTIAAFLPLCLFPMGVLIINGIMHSMPGPVYNGYFGLGALFHLVFGILLTLGIVLQKFNF